MRIFAACLSGYVVFLLSLAGIREEKLVLHRIFFTALDVGLAFVSHGAEVWIEHKGTSQLNLNGDPERCERCSRPGGRAPMVWQPGSVLLRASTRACQQELSVFRGKGPLFFKTFPPRLSVLSGAGLVGPTGARMSNGYKVLLFNRDFTDLR